MLMMAAAVFSACLPVALLAQSREVTGKVTAFGSGAPLADATVGVSGAQVGARTNAEGVYKLRIPSGDVTIVARAIGYKRNTVKISASASTLDFTLEKDVLQLEGVTVTGQATTIDKRNASTAIVSISAEELTKAPAKSVEGNLAGKVTGAQIFENSGAPGGGMQIQIRGATSVLGQGDPLYVIDGIIVSNASIAGGLNTITRAGSSSGGTGSSQDQTVNRLADINPNDIESIEVLKSAAATAIYGSRATNGVVVITTKKGKAGTTRFSVTQRVGSGSALKTLSSRHFTSYAQVAPFLGGSAQADSVAKVNCGTGACPFYDWQGQLYGNVDPSFESVVSASGGSGNTRFYASLNDRLNKGIQFNTGARRTSGRVNIDQTIGDKLTASVGVDITHNFVQNGIGGNDNSGTSPIYTFGYAPAIYDIRQKDASGQYVQMFMNGGGNGTSNPFAVLSNITNNEDTYRMTGSVRLGYALLSTAKNTIQLTYIGGLDRYQLEGRQYSPNFLQYESADGFLGTSNQGSASSRQINQSINGVWTFNPTWSWWNSAQTSVGGTYETQYLNTFNIRVRGLLPTRQTVLNSPDQAYTQTINEFRDQSYYANEQFIFFGEKLALSAGVRMDRSSANGDREKFYAFPKFSGSYRFVSPLKGITGLIDEVKVRAAIGQSGNRPNYGNRDITVASGGVNSGQSSLVANGGTATAPIGNVAIKPEVMNETEFGFDASFWKQRVAVEATKYQRTIKDLLLNYPLPLSSGLAFQIINGGQLSTNGFEGAITIVPISRRDLEWTFRTTYQTNVQHTDYIPVPAFSVAGSFGSSYGRNRIAAGTISTKIWGNSPFSCINKTVNGAVVIGTGSDGLPCHQLAYGETMTGQVVRDSILKDANSRHTVQFLNTVTYKRFSFSGLLDWRNGGYTSTMTKNLFDEGGNSRDFDAASPKAGVLLGDYRYGNWSNGDIRGYTDDGTYVKLREITVSFDAPKRWADVAKARSMRISLSGRNLAMWSKYWSYDPEFSNFGNSNFNRFIDLAPYPSTKQFFFSIDLGY
jgi:TonB-linked SusC/RagA family outer membrane protein